VNIGTSLTRNDHKCISEKEMVYGKLYQSINSFRNTDSLFTVTASGKLIWFCEGNDGPSGSYISSGAEFFEAPKGTTLILSN
jgi:hypothetical protein